MLRWHGLLKSFFVFYFILFFVEDKELFILYHGCRWPGDERSQGISSRFIDVVMPDYLLAMIAADAAVTRLILNISNEDFSGAFY